MNRAQARRSWRSILAFAISASALPASAQTTGDLHGTVKDASSLPIPGALVEVSSSVLIRPRQTSSDLEGRFQFLYLPPGVYTVLARLTGFQDAVQPEVRVSLGETITVPLTLPLTVATSVTVSDETPLVDTVNARVGISANESILSNLPLGRNFASLASILGNVGTDILGPTFFGASSLENSFGVDGVNVTGIRLGGQGKQVPMEFVQEVEIRSGGYEAEFGKAFGASINVITKAGGNEYHGNAFGYYDSDSLGARDQHVADRDVVLKPALEVPRQYEVGLSLGGPLFRDRLWFFGAYDRARIDQNYRAIDHLMYTPDGIENSYQDRSDRMTTDLFATNLSWAPSPSQTFALSIVGDPATFSGRFATSSAVAFTSNGPASAEIIQRKSGGTDVSARWTGFLGTLIAEAQYGYHEESRRESSDFANQPAIVEIRSGRAQFISGSGPFSGILNSGGLVDETYRRNIFQAKATLPLRKHEIKAGFGYEVENPNKTNGISGGELIVRRLAPNGTFLFATHTYLAQLPLNCTHRTDGTQGNFGLIDPHDCNAWQPAYQIRSDFRSRGASAFLQDSARILSNLTLKVGIRFDSQELVDTFGNVRLKLTDQWSPRLAVIWDPGEKGRSKVFASYGRYYQVIPQEIQATIMSSELHMFAYNYSPDRDLVNDRGLADFASVSGVEYIPDDLKGTYQDEATAGAEVQLGSSWSVGLRGTYRALGRALEDRCDVSEPRTGLAGLVPESELRFGNCAMVNPGEGALGELKDPSNPACFEDFPANQKPRPCDTVKARRYYRGLEVVVQHRPTKNLYLLASYVYSRLTGNYEGLINTVGNGGFQISPNLNQDFDYIDVLPNNSGRLLNDRTHQLKVSGYYTLPFGLGAGAVFQFASGQPLSLFGGAPQGYDTRFLVPRGTYGELPSTYSLDLHLQYARSIGNVSVTPILDIFNLTNVQRSTSRSQIYDTFGTKDQSKPPFTNPTNPRFGKDVDWQSPRLVRLGLKVAF